MSIGYFGEHIIFETSSDKVLTFNDFKRSTSIVVEQHKIIGKKPLSEVCGQELDSVSFSISLNYSLGVIPQDIIDKLNELCSNGIAETLVIGGKVIGLDKFLLKEVSTAYDIIYNNGFIYAAKIDLTLEEYISDVSLNTSTNTSGNVKKASTYYSVPSVDTSVANNVVNSVGNTYNLGNTDSAIYPFLTEIVEGLY